MDKRNTREAVIKNLRKLDINIEDLTDGAIVWLEKIEDVLNKRINQTNSCINTLKTITFDMSSIAKELNTSRQNLYNSYKGLLKQYLEIATQDIPINPMRQIEQLREDKAKLQHDIDLLMVKDVENEIMIKQLDDMSIKLENANKQHQTDCERIMILNNELIKMRNELTLLKNKD